MREACYCVLPLGWKQLANFCLGCIGLNLLLLRYIYVLNDYIMSCAHGQWLTGFTVFPFNHILCGIYFIIKQQAVAWLVMNIARHLCMRCEVMLS